MRLCMTALLGSALVVGAGSYAGAAMIYTGNGAGGFGGGMGSATLSVSDTPSGTISFSLSSPNSMSGNDFVVYIGSSNTGFSSNSGMKDNQDTGREIVTAWNGSQQPLITFASGFNANYAISVQPGIYAGLFTLATGGSGSLTPGPSANIAGSGTAGSPYTFSINASDIGLTPNSGQSFRFVATEISSTAYLSDETIGTSSVTNPQNAPNPGNTGDLSFSDFKTYTLSAPVPEPATLGLLALAGIGAMSRRRRRSA